VQLLRLFSGAMDHSALPIAHLPPKNAVSMTKFHGINNTDIFYVTKSSRYCFYPTRVGMTSSTRVGID
jgi:hypothetical protein